MFKNHVYGIDLGSNMIKIYSQNSNEILKEKNMIAIRNKDTVLAVGDEAYEIYEKNPTNVKVSSPMLNGMIANTVTWRSCFNCCWIRPDAALGGTR